jgi:hypothetical protein
MRRGGSQLSSATSVHAMDTDFLSGVASERVVHIVNLMRELSLVQLREVQQQAVHLANAKAPLLRLPPKVRKIIYMFAIRDYFAPLSENIDHNWLDSRQKPPFFGTSRLILRECNQLFPVAPFRIVILRKDHLYRVAELDPGWLSNQVGLSGLSRMKSERPSDSLHSAKITASEMRTQEGHISGVVIFKEHLHIGPKAWFTYELPPVQRGVRSVG